MCREYSGSGGRTIIGVERAFDRDEEVGLLLLSQAALALGDYALARDRVKEGITLSRDIRDLANLAYFVETLAVIESREGGHLRVATLLGAATGLRETVGADVYAFYLPDEHLRAAAEMSARTALGDEAYDDALTPADHWIRPPSPNSPCSGSGLRFE